MEVTNQVESIDNECVSLNKCRVAHKRNMRNLAGEGFANWNVGGQARKTHRKIK